MQSSIGNKRKWVSLPLEEGSRDSGDQVPGVGRAHSDSEPASDSHDPTSPNHTLHSNRAHDSSRSKWPALCSVHTFFFPPRWFHLHLMFSTACSTTICVCLQAFFSHTYLQQSWTEFKSFLILWHFPGYLVFWSSSCFTSQIKSLTDIMLRKRNTNIV